MPKIAILVLLALLSLREIVASESPEEFEPLYAGTQLAFYPTNVAPGHISIQPFIFGIRNYGFYNDQWSLQSSKNTDALSLLLALETGITKSLDLTLLLNMKSSRCGSQHSYLFGDINVYGGIQVSRNKKGSWVPDCRLLIGESFPTGTYQNLNPTMEMSDASGTGAFATSFASVVRKIFYTYPHPLSLNLNLFYTIFSKVNVEGFCIYGNNEEMQNSVVPGNQFIANLGIELCLTQYWELGMDIRYVHTNNSCKNRATQESGIGLPSSEILSLAPCLEYNFSQDFSVAAGAWFSVLGRNAEAFAGGVANVFVYF